MMYNGPGGSPVRDSVCCGVSHPKKINILQLLTNAAKPLQAEE